MLNIAKKIYIQVSIIVFPYFLNKKIWIWRALDVDRYAQTFASKGYSLEFTMILPFIPDEI